MKNYRINFLEEERQPVLDIVTRSNDVILNQIEPEGVFFTIQLEDDQADAAYDAMLGRIEREIRTPKLTTLEGAPTPTTTVL
jgi:hypothetical protein